MCLLLFFLLVPGRCFVVRVGMEGAGEGGYRGCSAGRGGATVHDFSLLFMYCSFFFWFS